MRKVSKISDVGSDYSEVTDRQTTINTESDSVLNLYMTESPPSVSRLSISDETSEPELPSAPIENSRKNFDHSSPSKVKISG